MKPHQCSLCGRTFKRSRDASKHLRDAHEGEGSVVPTGPRRYNLLGKNKNEECDQEEDLMAD